MVSRLWPAVFAPVLYVFLAELLGASLLIRIFIAPRFFAHCSLAATRDPRDRGLVCTLLDLRFTLEALLLSGCCELGHEAADLHKQP